jgi:hypothetical protein
MKLHAKVVVATQHRPTIARAFALAVGAHPNAKLLGEWGPPGCAAKAQVLGKDQVGLGQGPHTHTIGVQVGAMAIEQGGQGSRQVCILACS